MTIIFAKQAHFALGTDSNGDTTIETLVDIFYELPDANPFVFLIALVGILALVFHNKINSMNACNHT